MSDADEQNSQNATPETAAVPLKKETIRVTLRANPDASAPKAPSADAPKPAVPAPTVPLSGAPKPAVPAPTVPLSGAPKPAVPAPTVKLNTPSKPITPGGAAPAAPAPTKPLSTPGGPADTKPLPKATVNLSTANSPSSPTADPAASPTDQEGDFLEETAPIELSGQESKVVPMILSIVLFLLAAAVLFLEYSSNQMVDQGFKVFGG